jgi:hypothetical protein
VTAPSEAQIARLDAHYGEFQGLVADARRDFDRGRLDAAAARCQIAAMYAWTNPVGLFGSDEIEELLCRLGERLPARTPRTRQDGSRTVLHVVTQVYQTGGPTQAISSWMEQDPHSRHRVCLTRQSATVVPPKILDGLESPSDVVRLDRRPGGALARAAALRAEAAGADFVILHSHPCDVVPIIAFGAGDVSAPLVHMDHSDHVFWIGRRIARLLYSMRDSGRSVAISRRGIEPERIHVMARALRIAERKIERSEAKRRLGLPEDKVLVVSAADGYKYRSVGGPPYLDLIRPVVERHPDMIFRAAGPAPEGDWAAAAEATGGRIQGLGLLPDASVLQQAADVYVDSFPFASLTSLLEAGSFSTPVMTFRGHPEGCGVLGSDTRGLDEHMPAPATPEEFHEELGRLVADRELRLELGAKTRQAIIDTHTGAGWQASVAELYEQAARHNSPPRVGPAERRTGWLDVLVDLVQEQTGYSQGVPGALRLHLGLLPPRDRAVAAYRLARTGVRPAAREVTPDWLRAPVARARRRLKAAGSGLSRRTAQAA